MFGTGETLVSSDGYTLDIAYMARPEAEEIQLDLILDYRSNPDLYPAFQAYFRKWQPPFIAIWGKNDPHFIPAGALPISAICRTRKSTSSTLAISRSKSRI